MKADNHLKFVILSADHLPLVWKWLQEPHVAEFWKETENEQEFRDSHLAWLSENGVIAHVVYLDETPIGYIQHYNAKQAGADWWPDAAEGTYGIDQFIGVPAFVGKGHGTRFIRTYVESLFQNPKVTEVIVDPDPRNARAIRAYEKVGFTKVGPVKTPDGEALLMRIRATN